LVSVDENLFLAIYQSNLDPI